MPLLGKTRLDEYEVKMQPPVGNVIVDYVLAPDVERAAWQALELSSQRNCTLKDVRNVMSGKEFPNNWEEIHDADDDQFETCTFDEFMAGMSMWQLPSSHSFLMRIYNRDTNKVKEHATNKKTWHASDS